MAKPIEHARSSVKKWGGVEEDYLEIHNFMDSSKGAIADARHRCLLHTSFAIQPGGIFERIFGVTIKNSDDRDVAVRAICEQHILEDFQMRFIPTPQDFLTNMSVEPWMLNGIAGKPESCRNFDLGRPKKVGPPRKKEETEAVVLNAGEEFFDNSNELESKGDKNV